MLRYDNPIVFLVEFLCADQHAFNLVNGAFAKVLVNSSYNSSLKSAMIAYNESVHICIQSN